MQLSLRAPRETPDLSWRVLGLLNLFRLLVPLLLAGIFAAGNQPRIVGDTYPDLFRIAIAGYIVSGLVLLLLLKRRSRTTVRHAYVPVLLDIAILALIVFASGGAESGLGIALLVPVGGLSLLVDTRAAMLIAAGATLALLSQQAVLLALGSAGTIGFAQAGYYGVALFLVAAVSASMATRLRESEETIRQRDIDVANLAELSEYIVQHLRESLVVVDSEDRVRLINESARQLLGADARPGALLGEISPRLLYHVESWRRRPEGAPLGEARFISADGAREVEASFAALGGERPAPLIAFLEDTSRLAEQVQQTKLAALGRLSASIAHEIRNPVAAISHAAQLLAEAVPPASEQRRLTEIMTANTLRVSSIVANVLQLSRREGTRPERLPVGGWMADFATEYCATVQLQATQLQLTAPVPELEVRVDPSHLQQIVWNLCDNAVRHSETLPGPPPVELIAGRMRSTGRPYLEVADRGTGIDAALVERIFEPFFSSRHGGTGLGLFIARELAQCNGALLRYEPRVGGGSVFRIVFADPLRWEV